MNPTPLSAHSRFRRDVTQVENPGPAMVPGNSVAKDPGVVHQAGRVRVRLHGVASQKVLQGVIAPGHHVGVRHRHARRNGIATGFRLLRSDC